MAKSMYQQYEAFQEKRKTLVALTHELQGLLHSLDMAETENKINQLESLVQSDSFKVLVLGEFKRGKSTFINAMLGDEILPAYARPCTAIINEVKWGEPRRALLHPAKTTENAEVLQPQEVPVEQLEEYVVIQDDVSELHGNRYDRVELFWPLALCQNGVEIIDSPGLNEHDIRQKVTTDYLSRVDAILFVLSCEALASQSELEVVDNIQKMGHEDIFFICNRFNMIRAKEQEDVRKYGISRLAPKTKRGAERVFFISALDALEGRIENDGERVTKSGMLQVEQELEKFLANERGRLKILRPAREVQTAIYDARRIIPARESMLKTDMKTLEDRFEGAQEPLRRLEVERDQIVKRIDNFRDDIRMTISAEACSFYRSLPEKVDEWVKALETKSTVNFVSFEGTKSQAERLVKEVIASLGSKVESEFLGWQHEILQPLVTGRLAGLMQELDERATSFVDKIDTLRLEVSGSTISVDGVGPKRVGAVERVLSAAGGFFIGGFGSAGLGAVFGYQEMAKSIVPQMGLAILTIVLVGLNPLVLIPVMAGGGFIQGLWSAKSTNTKIKEEVGKRYATSIRDLAPQRGNDVAEAVVKELSKIQDGVNQGLGREIQSVRDQVNSILAEKQKGQANVDQKLREIESLRRELDVIDSEVDALIAEVAIPT